MHGFLGFLLVLALPYLTKGENSTLDPKLAEFVCELHRYENPINRDHFYYPEAGATMLNFSRNFNFKDYHYDGLVGGILSNEGYKYYVSTHPEARDKFMPVYHGYHEKMKHNYYSKPHEPYNQGEGVAFYVSKVQGYQMAKYPLWTLDGQPIDFVGDLGYDTVYTKNLTEHLLPDKEDYVVYRVLGYVWDLNEVDSVTLRVKSKLQMTSLDGVVAETNLTKHLFIHGQYNYVTPLYQLFDEKDQNYYYKTLMDQPDQDRANFVDVVAYIIKENYAANFSAPCNASSGALVPLISAYAKSDVYSTTVLFLSDQTYKKAEEDMKVQFLNRTVLGYVATENMACEPHYRLNIYRSWSDSDLVSGLNTLDQYVYLAPLAAKDGHLLFYDQSFYLW